MNQSHARTTNRAAISAQLPTGVRASLQRFLALMIIMASFAIAYTWSVSEIFKHEMFEFTLDPYRIFSCIVCVLVVALAIPSDFKRLSVRAAALLIVWTFIPIACLGALTEASLDWVYLCCMFWVVVSIVLRAPMHIPISPLSTSWTPVVFVLVAVSAPALYAYMISGPTASIDFFDPLSYYDVREASIASRPQEFLGYIISWFGKVALPLVVLIPFYTRRWRHMLWSVGGVAVGLVLLLFTGEKHYIFRILLVLLLPWILQGKHPLSRVATFCSLGILFATALDYFGAMDTLSNIVVRRTWFVPAMLSYFYFDLFQGAPVYLAGTRLGDIFGITGLTASPAQTIGRIYFGDPLISANNGVLADGFMNFGILGMIIWACALGLLLVLADSLRRGKPGVLVDGILLASVLSFVDGFLLTVLVSHGFLFALLLIYLLPPAEAYPRHSASMPAHAGPSCAQRFY